MRYLNGTFANRTRSLSSQGLAGIARARAGAAAWPTRAVKFIVPFGPGAGADIGARLFAEKLTQKWGQPVVVENRPGGDSIVAINAFLSANDDHVLLFGPSGNFTVHPFIYSKLNYNPADLIPIARASNTILAARREGGRALQAPSRNSPRPRAKPRQVQLRGGAGHHRVHLLGLSASREAADHPGALSRHQRGAGRSRRRPHPGGDVVLCDRAAADQRRPHQAARGQQQDPHRRRRRTCRPRASRAIRRSRSKGWSACSG